MPSSRRSGARASAARRVGERAPAPNGERSSTRVGQGPPTAGLGEIGPPDRRWTIVAVAVLVVAAAIRLYDLPLAPFHNDEGVNGWFTTNLVRSGIYRYDPANYHGPTLYYFALASETLVGLNDWAMRLVPVFFGLATVGLVLAMRRWIGAVGSLSAAVLLAVSPGWVYFSRYFIHETLLVCFTVALVYFAARWRESGRTAFLMLAAATAALLFATKETAILTVAVLLIALGCLPLYDRLRRMQGGERPRRKADGAEQTLDERILAAFGNGKVVVPLPLVGAIGVFVVVYVLFYSSFFTNWPKGLVDSFASLAIWTTTGVQDQVHSIVTYLEWLVREELPILVLAVIGGLLAVLSGRSRFALFAALWAAGLFAAYSLIAYKTPWLALNFVVPMAIVAGYGIERMWQAWRGRRALVVGIVALAAVVSGYGAVRLSFFDYDVDTNPYVYAHTVRDIYRLVDDVAAAGGKLGAGAATPIVIMSPDYWPLPWYWRDDPKAGFYGQVIDTTEPLVLLRKDQEATMSTSFASAYDRRGEYTLRPGVQLVLYVRHS
jgi:uncharacterized protein (TIGR03663 family)